MILSLGFASMTSISIVSVSKQSKASHHFTPDRSSFRGMAISGEYTFTWQCGCRSFIPESGIVLVTKTFGFTATEQKAGYLNFIIVNCINFGTLLCNL